MNENPNKPPIEGTRKVFREWVYLLFIGAIAITFVAMINKGNILILLGILGSYIFTVTLVTLVMKIIHKIHGLDTRSWRL